MSGRGRKQPNRKSRARTSQPSAKKKPPSTAVQTPARSVQARPAARAPVEPEELKGLGTSGSRTATAPRRGPAPARRPSSGAGPGRPATGRGSRAERRKRNQRIGVIVGALALAGAAVGSIIAGQAGDPAPASSATGAPASAGVQAVTPASPSPATSPVPSPPAPAPPGPDQAAAAPAGLSMTITCPSGAGASPRFGHEITAPTPYEVTIDYGDGDVYTDDSDHLGAIFSHTYQETGTYQVNAVLTDPAGRTTTAACSYTWSP